MDAATMQALSESIQNITAGPRVHPGRQQYAPVQHQQQPPVQQQKMYTPPPPADAKIATHMGYTRKMQFSYNVDGGGREYHRVYDFDISFDSMGVDFLPLDGFFLAIQYSEKKFVAASLLMHRREVLGVILRQDEPRIIRHGGKYFMHLNFLRDNSYPGIPLLGCRQDTLTLRVVVADKVGTNFFLMIEGMNYGVRDLRNWVSTQPFSFDINWPGERCVDVMTVRDGHLNCQNAKARWVPQQSGPPNKERTAAERGAGQQSVAEEKISYNQVEYDPDSPAMLNLNPPPRYPTPDYHTPRKDIDTFLNGLGAAS